MTSVTYTMMCNSTYSNGGATSNAGTFANSYAGPVTKTDISGTRMDNNPTGYAVGYYCVKIVSNDTTFYTNVIKVQSTLLNGQYYSNVGFTWNNADPLTSAPYTYVPITTGNVYEYSGGANAGLTSFGFASFLYPLGGGKSVMLITLHNIETPYSIAITSGSEFTINSSQQTTSNLVYLTGQTSPTYAFYGGYDYYYPNGTSVQQYLPAGVNVTATCTAPNGTYTTSLTTTQFAAGVSTFAFGNQSIDYGVSTPQVVLSGGTPDDYMYQLTAAYSGLILTPGPDPVTGNLTGDTITNVSFYSNGAFNSSTAATDWNNTTGGTLVYSSTSDLVLTQTSADYSTHPRSGLYYYVALTYDRSVTIGRDTTITTYTIKSNLVIFA